MPKLDLTNPSFNSIAVCAQILAIGALSDLFGSITVKGMSSYWYIIKMKRDKYNGVEYGTLGELLGFSCGELQSYSICVQLDHQKKKSTCYCEE